MKHASAFLLAATGRPIASTLGAVAILWATPVSAQEPLGASSTPLETVRVERALERRFSCLGCHRVDASGGMIGPALDGLGARADFAYTLAVLRNPSGMIPGTLMPHQPMPEEESRRLAAYLVALPEQGVPSGTAQAPPALGPGDAADGASLYARHCAACHGETGAGDGWNAENLPVTPTAHGDAALMSQRSDDTLYDAIAVGGFVLDKSNRMPAFGSMLSAEQIRALVAHIRRLCDCTQPAWAGRLP